MPNWVTNRIEAPKDILDTLMSVDENGKDFVDFNNVIQMPDNISRENIDMAKMNPFGEDNWYNWSISNWGTKWNAADFVRESDNVLVFETAWSHPFPVFEELSQSFPNDELLIAYADEDTGYNLGVYRSKAGETVEEDSLTEGSPEAMVFFNTVTGSDRLGELKIDIDSCKEFLADPESREEYKERVEKELEYCESEMESIKDAQESLKKNYPNLDFTKVESFLHIS